jgi:hypothetical protein
LPPLFSDDHLGEYAKPNPGVVVLVLEYVRNGANQTVGEKRRGKTGAIG